MKYITQLLITCALVMAFSNTASACVSAGYSHTCQDDCNSYSGIMYEICVYGGARHE